MHIKVLGDKIKIQKKKTKRGKGTSYLVLSIIIFFGLLSVVKGDVKGILVIAPVVIIYLLYSSYQEGIEYVLELSSGDFLKKVPEESGYKKVYCYFTVKKIIVAYSYDFRLGGLVAELYVNEAKSPILISNNNNYSNKDFKEMISQELLSLRSNKIEIKIKHSN